MLASCASSSIQEINDWYRNQALNNIFFSHFGPFDWGHQDTHTHTRKLRPLGSESWEFRFVLFSLVSLSVFRILSIQTGWRMPNSARKVQENILNCHYFICNFTKLPSIALKERIAQFSCGIVAKPFIMQTYCRFIERMRSLRWILLLFDHSIWNNAEKIRERESKKKTYIKHIFICSNAANSKILSHTKRLHGRFSKHFFGCLHTIQIEISFQANGHNEERLDCVRACVFR